MVVIDMSIFGKKTHRELEPILSSVMTNMANNYKDAAQEAFKDFEKKAAQLDREGKLSDKQKEYYRQVTDELRGKLKNFTHKDQTPYWT